MRSPNLPAKRLSTARVMISSNYSNSYLKDWSRRKALQLPIPRDTGLVSNFSSRSGSIILQYDRQVYIIITPHVVVVVEVAS